MLTLTLFVRVVEFVGGDQDQVVRHKVYLYVFDGFLMAICLIALNTLHPGGLGARKAWDGREDDMMR